MKSKAVFLVALIFLFSAFTFAQEATKDKRPEKRGRMGRLNLTEEQKAKMTDFRFELQKKQIALKAKKQTAHIELKQLLNGEKIDKALIEKKLNEIAKLEVEQKINFINHWEQVNQILTPEQKDSWKRVLKMFDAPMRQRMMKNFIKNRGFQRGMRGPGKSRSEIPGFNNSDNEFASMYAPDLENSDFDDSAEITEPNTDAFDELFDMESLEPEPPDPDLE
jgi:Spy/CpxP family protein refolding chaperone